MKRLLITSTLVFVTVVLAVVISFETIVYGFVTPPLGMVSLGPISLFSVRPCPQVWPPQGWSRPCGEKQPWALIGVIRWPRGEVWQGELINVRLYR